MSSKHHRPKPLLPCARRRDAPPAAGEQSASSRGVHDKLGLQVQSLAVAVDDKGPGARTKALRALDMCRLQYRDAMAGSVLQKQFIKLPSIDVKTCMNR